VRPRDNPGRDTSYIFSADKKVFSGGKRGNWNFERNVQQ
jgi:hypothetical protein